MDFKLRKIIIAVYIPAFLTSFCMGMLAPTIPAPITTAFIVYSLFHLLYLNNNLLLTQIQQQRLSLMDKRCYTKSTADII